MKRDRVIYVLIAVMFFFSFVSLYNRYSFGVWFPFIDPNRIEFMDRTYYPSGIESENLKGKLVMVRSSFYWGRSLYVLKEDYVSINSPNLYKTYMKVYLEMSDGKFQTYVISGGP